jgi:hypothetical protein
MKGISRETAGAFIRGSAILNHKWSKCGSPEPRMARISERRLSSISVAADRLAAVAGRQSLGDADQLGDLPTWPILTNREIEASLGHHSANRPVR